MASILRSGIALLALCSIPAIPAAAQDPIDLSTAVSVATRSVTHTWSISKTGSSQSGLAGDTLPGATWTVNVSETTTASTFIRGTITIKNLTGAPVAFTASAVLDDGTSPQLECPPSVDAFKEVACIFKGEVGATGSVLFVTVTTGGFIITESVSLNFNTTITGESATVTDTVQGVVLLNETLAAGQGPWTFTITDQPLVCPDQSRDQYVNYVFEVNRHNAAFLEIAGGEKAGASANVTYTCRAGFADVVKTTAGVVDPSYSWKFPLFNGPDGYTSDWANLIGGAESGGDADGVLQFVNSLNPTRTYTVCEVHLPAGWGATWQLNGQPVVPYNPDADNNPPEDLGNRCVDFGAGTPYPVVEGQTITFTIDNRPPGTGGNQPRTPGYWKNWNRCTTGGQADNADRQALRAGLLAGQGWMLGFWLVEDVLDPTIGGGVTWDDMAADALLVPIDSCEEAVEILDTRVVNVNGTVGDGKKLASDGARKLARNLLAAQFNFAAGACTTQAALDAAAAAEALLDSINFDGTSTAIYLKSGALYDQAIALAGILDAYNNGNFCGAP